MLTVIPTDEARMSSSRLIQRLLRRRRPAPGPASSRIDIQPPALWGQAEPVWSSLWSWLRQGQAPSPAPGRVLEHARIDFCNALRGVRCEDALDLLRRAQHARSLRELWHLRAELYSIVARHANQVEADKRLAQVNRHFPIRATSATGPQIAERHAKSSST
jgi:hypothetical protein